MWMCCGARRRTQMGCLRCDHVASILYYDPVFVMTEDDLQASRLSTTHIQMLHPLPAVKILRSTGDTDMMYLILREDADVEEQTRRRDEYQDRMNDHAIPPQLSKLNLDDYRNDESQNRRSDDNYSVLPLGNTLLEQFEQFEQQG